MFKEYRSKNQEERIRNENTTENVKTNTLEDKLINNRIIFYGHVLRINEDRIPKKILNFKLKGKYPEGRGKSRWEQLVRKYITQRERRIWQKLRRNCRRKEVDGVAWLLGIKWKH
jgi:hypothetical protein